MPDVAPWYAVGGRGGLGILRGMTMTSRVPLAGGSSAYRSWPRRRTTSAASSAFASHGRLTIVVITHRLATVRFADSIHVLDAGRLVESGDWQRLLNGSAGRFRAMCRARGLPV